MRINVRPLTDAQIVPAPEPMQLDPLSERVHTRGGTRVDGRALPTMATTRSHPRWRWGRPVDPPRSPATPTIMSPSELEPQRPRESSAWTSVTEHFR